MMMAASFHGRRTVVRAILVHITNTIATPDTAVRLFATKRFRPKRRPGRNYRPTVARTKKVRDWAPGNPQKYVDLGEVKNPQDNLEEQFGPLAADVIREEENYRARRMGQHDIDVPEDYAGETMRAMDYYLAEEGSLEV